MTMTTTTNITTPTPKGIAPQAETDGLGRVIEQAPTEDLEAVAALLHVARQQWGDRAEQRLELLVALHLRERINRS